MPKTPIDYSKSCIYKICCKDTNITDCYIGSTTNFTKRKNGHKSSCINENNKLYNLNVYKFIRDNGGWDNWDMVLVEKVNVNDGNELKKEERKWIEQLNSTLNSNIPTRTNKEWYIDTKQIRLQQVKEYTEKNKDKKKEYLKEYTEKNKEKILQYKKEYRQKNKKEINKKQLEKVECTICNSLITKCNLGRHQKTKKCMNAK